MKALDVSAGTATRDVHGVYDKLGVSTRAGALDREIRVPYFVVRLRRGGPWDWSRTMRDQDGWNEHGFRSVRSTHAIAIGERAAVSDLGEWWARAFEELHDVVARHSLATSGPDGALYSSAWFEDEIGDVVAFTPVTSEPKASRDDRVKPYVVPAAELAVLLHEGSLTDLDRTFAALGTFVFERAIAVEGPIREYYLVTTFDTPDENRHRTEVASPIFQTSTRG